MVTIVKAVQEIRAVVNKLEQKENESWSKKIEEINTKVIKQIDDEISKIQSDTAKAESGKQKGTNVKGENTVKKCKYCIVSINWTANFSTQKRSIQIFFMGENALKSCATSDTQNFVSGGNDKMDVEEKTVSTCI